MPATDKKPDMSGDALDDNVYIEESVEQEVKNVDDVATGAKRKTQAQKKKAKKARTSDPFNGVQIWTKDTQEQHAYLCDRQKKALSDLTSVELEEQALEEHALVDNLRFKHKKANGEEDSEHVLEALPNYVKFGMAGHKKLEKKPVELAQPVALVITHAAIRATELARVLTAEFGKTAKIAKLFAKHFKVEDQVFFLEKTPFHIGVGTPNRIKALVEQGHLRLDRLELVVIDAERNAKGFNIFENDAVRHDLFTFLGSCISHRTASKHTKIGLF